MAITAYPFDGTDTTEANYGLLFREFQDSGVAGSFGGASFRVTADSTGMTVKVNEGFAVIRGHAIKSTAIESVQIAAASTVARKDRIVLELEPGADTISIKSILGVPGASSPPALVQTDIGNYQVPLAIIDVAPGTISLGPSAVTEDRRYVGNVVGVWGTQTRPTAPRAGRFGINIDSGEPEFWDGNTWRPITPTITWAGVANKPATFPPSVHDHPWSAVTDKPSTFTPSPHSHSYSSLTSKPSSFPPSAHNHHWNDVQSKPSTFPPSSHSHSWGSITNRPFIVGKDHKHPGGDITTQVANSNRADGTDRCHQRSVSGGGPWYSVWVDGNYEFGRNTSSRRYKTNIEDISIAPADVLALRPRVYDRKDGEPLEDGSRNPGPTGEYGLIAEEVFETLPQIVTVDDGQIEAVRYDLLAVALLDVVKDQNIRIEKLEQLVSEVR